MPPTAAERLDALFRSADDPKLRHRLQIVLMAHRGRPPQDRHPLARRLLRRLTRRVAAQEGQGHTGQHPQTLADEIKRWVIEGAAEQGLDRANWTHEELVDHLLKTKGIRTSRSAVQRFCSGSASDCTGPRIAMTGATPPSRRRPRGIWPNWEKSGGR